MAFILDDPAFPLTLGQSISTEAFSPPIFACLCSPNLNTALKRLAEYKPLVGPLRLDVSCEAARTVVEFGGLPKETPPPPLVLAGEIVFATQLARLATRERIQPTAATLRVPPPAAERYTEFLGVALTQGETDSLAFRAEDARKPFLTANNGMWRMFEPALAQRLADLKQENGVRDRVRACLNETLASGHCSISDVAGRLAISERSLQRRLAEEGTSFQKELNLLREELARHYLARTRYSSAEISFLLGYADPNSFIRAFHIWTGSTPEAMRGALRPH